jgi:hypothetical protein
MRELGEATMTGGDPARIVEQARELVNVLRGLEEWDQGPGWMRPIPMVALNDHQVALIYSLVLLALVQKTGSTADRPGEPRYCEVRDRWLTCTAEELEEVRARLAEVWGSRLGPTSASAGRARVGHPERQRGAWRDARERCAK